MQTCARALFTLHERTNACLPPSPAGPRRSPNHPTVAQLLPPPRATPCPRPRLAPPAPRVSASSSPTTVAQMAEARGIDLATAESLLQSEKRRPRKRKNDGGRGGGASSAAEAVEEELRRNRALSSRINYDVVSLLALTEADAPSMPSGDPGGGRGMTMTLGSIGAAMDSEGGGGRGRVSGSEADGFSETLSMGRGSEGSRASSPRY